jgi:hypothetical protein
MLHYSRQRSGTAEALRRISYGLVFRCSRPVRRRRFLLSPKCPPSILFWGYQVSFPGGQGTESWSYYSPSPSAGIKNEWSYTSTPPICLHDGGRDIFSLPSHSSGWLNLSVYNWVWVNLLRIADTTLLNNAFLCLFIQSSLLAPAVSPRLYRSAIMLRYTSTICSKYMSSESSLNAQLRFIELTLFLHTGRSSCVLCSAQSRVTKKKMVAQVHCT